MIIDARKVVLPACHYRGLGRGTNRPASLKAISKTLIQEYWPQTKKGPHEADLWSLWEIGTG